MLNFIGTIHCGFTNNEELIPIIDNLNAEIVLVEISQQDIDNNNIENYPDEMKFILKWCKNNNINCYGFDSDINTLHENYTKENENKLMEFQMKEIKKRNWKDFNISKINSLIDEDDSFQVTDFNKSKEREIEMKNNILDITKLNDDKKIVILTGCGHLDFFKLEFSDANFPLSKH